MVETALPRAPAVAARCSARRSTSTSPTRPDTAALAPEFRRERVHEVMAIFLDRALPTGALVILEDVHWMDEASCAVLEIIVENLASDRRCSARPAATSRRGSVGAGATPTCARSGRRRSRRSRRPLRSSPRPRTRRCARTRSRRSPSAPRETRSSWPSCLQAAAVDGRRRRHPPRLDRRRDHRADRPAPDRRSAACCATRRCSGHTFRVDELNALIADERRDRRTKRRGGASTGS